MSDDLGKKIQQIAQMLGQDEVPDNVKELVSILANSLGKKEDGNSQAVRTETVNEVKPDENRQEDEAPAISQEALDTAKHMADRFNSSGDPRINLLMAIRPFMNNRRQKKIGNCIQLLQIAGLSRLINDREK
jgi:hypothetical protein